MKHDKTQNNNNHNGHSEGNPMVGTLPITPLFSEATSQPADIVQHLDKLIKEFMSTENMRLRTNLSPRLLVHVIRAELFAQYCDDHGFEKSAARMRDFRDYLLQLSVGIKGWGTENLIKALQAARAPMYQFGENGGMREKVGRLLGR